MKMLIGCVVIILIVGCDPQKPPTLTTERKQFDDYKSLWYPGSENSRWEACKVFITEIDGHKFAVATTVHGVSICEVTAASHVVSTNHNQ